jgi:DNA-binding NtrC family response regulator
MFSDAIILVAGASLIDRETILQALGDQCHVVASQTTDDALAHLENSVDLVISEIKTDQLNGLDLMRRWKSRQSKTPFLMLADVHDAAAAVEVMRSGASDCILKPIDPDELRASVQQLIAAKGYNSHSNSNRNPPGGMRRKPVIEIPPDTSLEDLERAAVEQALMQHHGNRTHAARTLGISVRTLQRKLKVWGMPTISFPRPALNHSFLLTTAEHAQLPFGTQVH